MTPRLLALLSFAACLGVSACGGGETRTVGAQTPAEDRVAVERLVRAWARTDDAVLGCRLFSRDYLEEGDGLEGCSEADDWNAVPIRIERVSLEGDTGSVIFVEEGDRMRFPVIREGLSSDAYDGWKIDGDREEVSGGEKRGEKTETNATTETESVPETPEQRAAAYRECIEGRGAENVEQDDFPSVEFSGGGSPVRAMFGDSIEAAKQGLATLRKQKQFYSGRFGTVVLYAIGDPLADDLDTGLACAKKYLPKG